MISYAIVRGGVGFQVVEAIPGETVSIRIEFPTEDEARTWLNSHLTLLRTTDLAPWVEDRTA
jgi:hypothetical protein